jgi:hypothetical protein
MRDGFDTDIDPVLCLRKSCPSFLSFWGISIEYGPLLDFLDFPKELVTFFGLGA